MDRLKILHLNVNGLWGKKAIFDMLIDKHTPDVISINEVKTRRELKFEGYQKPIRLDRPLNSTIGGGVMLLVKKGLEFEEIELKSELLENEAVGANIILQDKSCLLYTSPSPRD